LGHLDYYVAFVGVRSEGLLLIDPSLFSLHRCESLSDQLRQQSERIGELDREIEEGRVAFESMQVTNSFMSDHIDFLERASEYQQSILASQLRNVEERYVICAKRICSRYPQYMASVAYTAVFVIDVRRPVLKN
jgi:hypothetical protein